MPHIRVARTARYETLGNENAPREIWFVLHGYGQLASTFIRSFDALDDAERLIVAPEALNRFYLVGVDSAPAAERPVGATWMTREDRDAEIVDYVEYLDALASCVLSGVRQKEARPRVVVLGFSQGTATATRWVTRGAVRPEHLLLWGGLVPPETDLASQALQCTTMHLVRGTRDRYVAEDRVRAEQKRLLDAGLNCRFVSYAGGHRIDADQLKAIAQSIQAVG